MIINKGTVLYLVDTKIGKILTRAVYDITTTGMLGYEYQQIKMVNFLPVPINTVYKVLDPKPDKYFTSNLKIGYGKKCYLVFTDKNLAQQALVNYVLPEMSKTAQAEADAIIEEYTKRVIKVEEIENRIKKESLKLQK